MAVKPNGMPKHRLVDSFEPGAGPWRLVSASGKNSAKDRAANPLLRLWSEVAADLEEAPKVVATGFIAEQADFAGAGTQGENGRDGAASCGGGAGECEAGTHASVVLRRHAGGLQ